MSLLVALLLLLLTTPMSHANQHATPAVRTIVMAQTQVPPGAQPGGVTQTPDAELLTLLEAIRLSLENNLEIQMARYEPLLSEERITEAVGVYDPLLFTNYQKSEDQVPVASTFLNISAGEAVNSVETEEWVFDAGFSGVLPMGLEYSSTFENNKTKTDSAGSTLSPEYNSRWVSLVTLPLLKNLVTNDFSITVARSRTASDRTLADFQARLTDLIVSTEADYWELAASIANTRVAQKSLQTATELLEQTRVQYEVGVVSRVEVVQSEAGVAEREFALIGAENRERRAHDKLLNTILAPSERVYKERRVRPEPALFRDYDVDIDVAVNKALELRPELLSAREIVTDAELQLRLADNQVLPEFNLIGRYQWDGQSGSVTDLSDMRDPNNEISRSTGRSRWDTVDEFLEASGNRSYTIGAEFSIPLGNNTAEARATQRRIELRRSITSYRRAEQTVILDVRDAVRNLRSSIEGIQAAERNRVAQAESLDAEQERQRLGDSTPFQVLEREEDLQEAERQLIFSLQVHRNAIAALDRAQGTLLDNLNISVEGELQR
jgi:outer membrane protein TolC